MNKLKFILLLSVFSSYPCFSQQGYNEEYKNLLNQMEIKSVVYYESVNNFENIHKNKATITNKFFVNSDLYDLFQENINTDIIFAQLAEIPIYYAKTTGLECQSITNRELIEYMRMDLTTTDLMKQEFNKIPIYNEGLNVCFVMKNNNLYNREYIDQGDIGSYNIMSLDGPNGGGGGGPYPIAFIK